jgi:hypothetical protein
LKPGKVVQQAGSFSIRNMRSRGVAGWVDRRNEGLELKSPYSSSVHLSRFWMAFPAEYLPQIHGCMWVTGFEAWYFASFDPRMPKSHQLLIIPVQRDEA